MDAVRQIEVGDRPHRCVVGHAAFGWAVHGRRADEHIVGNRPEGAVLGDATRGRDPALTSCRVVGYGAQVGDEEVRGLLAAARLPD